MKYNITYDICITTPTTLICTFCASFSGFSSHSVGKIVECSQTGYVFSISYHGDSAR